jgi:hypothetical protein
VSANETRQPKRRDAGFLSSAKGFSLPPGRQFAAGSVRGYYIDFKVKAENPRWPAPELAGEELHVQTCQWALGCYERYLGGEGDKWLAAARSAGEYLLEDQQAGGEMDGGWIHRSPFPHTFRLKPPWLSAMAQGEGASLLVRLHAETGEDRWAEAARRALRPFDVPTSEGGVRAELGGRPFPEEYPTTPPSFVLNGGIFALWGLCDVGLGLGDADALRAFEEGVDTLAMNLHRWDTGYWSRYDLFPHPVVNVASSAYHALHLAQLESMQALAPRPEIESMRARWARYTESAVSPRRALAAKVAFRLVVPRNPTLARRLPWTRGQVA